MARTVGSSGEKTRAALDAAALDLIARHGFEAMSMRDLAAAVGVGAPALYRYHPTKQDLLDALISAHMADLDISVTNALKAAGDRPQHQLSAFVANHLDFHLARRLATQIANLELRSLNRDRLSRILKARNAYERRLRDILRAGNASGAFDVQDVPLTAMAIIQMLTGVIVWFRPDERLSLNDVTQTYLAMVARLVGQHGTPGQGD